jgi:hypothetical protein
VRNTMHRTAQRRTADRLGANASTSTRIRPLQSVLLVLVCLWRAQAQDGEATYNILLAPGQDAQPNSIAEDAYGRVRLCLCLCGSRKTGKPRLVHMLKKCRLSPSNFSLSYARSETNMKNLELHPRRDFEFSFSHGLPHHSQ